MKHILLSVLPRYLQSILNTTLTLNSPDYPCNPNSAMHFLNWLGGNYSLSNDFIYFTNTVHQVRRASHLSISLCLSDIFCYHAKQFNVTYLSKSTPSTWKLTTVQLFIASLQMFILQYQKSYLRQCTQTITNTRTPCLFKHR